VHCVGSISNAPLHLDFVTAHGIFRVAFKHTHPLESSLDKARYQALLYQFR
jgi:hypothetical protein